MTTKILSGIYSTAYNLTAPVTTLSITASGYLGAGLAAAGAGTYTIVNKGEVVGATYAVSLQGAGILTNTGTIWSTSTTSGRGIVLRKGGAVTNGAAGDTQALIGGYFGVEIDAASGTVANYGTLIGAGEYGVQLMEGGLVTNGAGGAAKALIESRNVGVVVQAVAGTVVNFGSVMTTGGASVGVQLTAGGTVTNGSATDTVARIVAGATGVLIQGVAGSMTNFGSVQATGTAGVALQLTDGGGVTNGANGDTGALIEGPKGVDILAVVGTVNNFGTINGVTNYGGAIGGFGVYFSNGGVITNGSATDTAAVIDDPYDAILIEGAAGTVNNFGAIGDPTAAAGVALGHGGAVTNGGTADTGALIDGRVGVSTAGAPATVRNFGTIQGALTGTLRCGVSLATGGNVINGPAGDIAAFIGGGVGVYAVNTASVSNFGTIRGLVDGVYLKGGGPITNGSATDTTALIQGKYAVTFRDFPGTLTNYGTVAGGPGGVGAALAAGGRITNGANADRTALISGHFGVEMASGSVINNGVISGNDGAYSIGLLMGKYGAFATNGSATNATALIGGNDGAVLYAGATLTNFGTVRGSSGLAVLLDDATARLNAEAGSVFIGAVEAGGGLVDVVGGVATMNGLVTSGTVEGAGTLALSGGISTFEAGAHLTVAKIVESGSGALVKITTTLTYANVWTQTTGTLAILTGDKMTFNGAGDSFAGTVTGPGAVAFTGGSDTLGGGAVLSAATMTINSATVTLSGAIDLALTLTATTPHLIVAAGGATLSGGGTLALSNNATNEVTGASSAATLTNLDKITGAGALGGGLMTLVNQAGGLIIGNVSTALTLDTGVKTITNAGVIESVSTGGVTIKSAVANSGSLTVTKGVLTLDGAVTGAGTVRIGGGTADVATSTFSENVTFTSTIGILELANSQGYAGKISGFSKTGTTSLDLLDIAFGGSTKATFSGTATSGVLTVTDGTHTAKITLTGDYTASTFTVASDGHGGTTVVDPTATPTGRAPPMLPLVNAMAGFGTQMGATSAALAAAPRRPCIALARPA